MYIFIYACLSVIILILFTWVLKIVLQDSIAKLLAISYIIGFEIFILVISIFFLNSIGGEDFFTKNSCIRIWVVSFSFCISIVIRNWDL